LRPARLGRGMYSIIDARDDAALELVMELLLIGQILVDTVGCLIEDLPEDAFPGEDSARVVIEMVAGSARPALEAAGEASCREAAGLIAAIGESVLRDLRAAAALAGASEAG
jgi:hypothetical protein